MSNKSLYDSSLQNHEKAAFDAAFYSLNQLKAFYRRASMGFLFAALASWALSAFFIAQFMAGSDFSYMADWRFMQYIYALIGVGLATALTYAEVNLFNSGKIREYWLVTLFSVAFAIFAETAATMQREQTAVQFKSQQSEVFKTTLNAANNLADNIGVSENQARLSRALAELETAKQANDTEYVKRLENRIKQLERLAEFESSNQNAMLATTLDKAKELEYDESNHQAMIKFLSESLGLSYVQASALLAFFLIVTFKLASHYLGFTKQRSERAIAIADGTISVDLPLSALPNAAQAAKQLAQPDTASFAALTADTVTQSKNSASAAPEQPKQPSTDSAKQTNSTVHVQLDSDLQSQFINDLKSRKVGTAFRDMKTWVSKNAQHQLALYRLQDVADELLAYAERQQIIKLNPEYREGNRKPKYLYID